ncbi:MAG: hypothetical protein ABI846_02510 [Rudaea sp.]
MLGTLAAAPLAAAIPPAERVVLDAIYAQTQGANWIVNRGWNGAAGTECQWFGVICDGEGAHVIALNLAGDNLVGSLPVLDGLSELSLVYLGQNSLGGSIPPLSGLGALTKFYIADNQLSGALPQLSRVAGLRGFVASGNRLSGPIPTLTTLKGLQYFDVGENRLTGRLPNLSGMTSLQYFSVESNQLGGMIPALANLPSLQYYDVGGNQLIGHLPTLTGLGDLQYFAANANRLSGNIPALSGLGSLEYFDVGGNGLVGTIPALTGLAALETFEVDGNDLTGPVPALDGLTNLTEIDVSGNGLSGALPAAPASLRPSGSALCNNALASTPNGAWDDATGIYPWYAGCTAAASGLALSSSDESVPTGTLSTLTATISTAKAIAAATTTTKGSVTISDDLGNVVCYVRIDATLIGSCNAILASGSSAHLTGAYSGSADIAPASAQISKTIAVTPRGNLDQHGWTGAWFNPSTSGQGIVFEVYPDISGVGAGLLGGGWFTYDAVAGGEDRKRWYTLSGPVTSSSASAWLDIVAPTGGNFNAGPVINSGNGANYVGHAMITFTDCRNGFLSYAFTDGSGKLGNIPLSRLDSNVTCDPTNAAGNGVPPGKFLLSGAWYNPATSGQGLLFDINPVQNTTFAAWYTYAPNGQAIDPSSGSWWNPYGPNLPPGGGASQRWYTLQIGSAQVGTSVLGNVGIFSAQGGVFDGDGNVATVQVGTAAITFGNCNALKLSYTFSSGTNAGQSGTIDLQRAGPVPAGCNL